MSTGFQPPPQPQPSGIQGKHVVLIAAIVAGVWMYERGRDKPDDNGGDVPLPVVVSPDGHAAAISYVIGFALGRAANDDKAADMLDSGKDPSIVATWAKTENTRVNVETRKPVDDALNKCGDDQKARAKVYRDLAKGYRKAVGK